MTELACPVCGTAIHACCTATVLLRNPQAPATAQATAATGAANGTATPSAKTVARISSKASSSRAKPQYTQDFTDFWSAYPRKKDKATASRAFAVAVRDGADPQVLIAEAASYARDPQRKDEFTKYPATWINAHSWEDEPDAAPKSTAHMLEVGSPDWVALNRPWEAK